MNKIDNLEIKRQILSEIKASDRILITRHIRPDGDAVGATKGLARILSLTYPEKEIFVINEDYSKHLEFLGGEDVEISDDVYRDSLCIVIDTGNVDRISNKKYSLCRKIIKIDHHIDNAPYGDISWVEDFRSSACEMIADFYYTFSDELKIDKEAATYIFTGIVTDSGRFRFSSTTGDTMRYAASFLEFGLDTENIFSHLYLEDFDYLRFQSNIFKKAKITENGVVYLHIDRKTQKKYNLTSETAGNVVSLLENIRGSLIWMAFVDADDKIRVRLRSRFVAINDLAEKYNGGGHAHACGATVYSKKEMGALISDADKLLKSYKKNNTGWL